MRFGVQYRREGTASRSPYRLVDEQGREIEWANRFLDLQRVRGLQELSLPAYAYTILHFVRWWSRQPGVDVMRFEANQFTESTLLDYVRAQREQPRQSAESINGRSMMLRRLFQFYFEEQMPHAPCLLQRHYWRLPGRVAEGRQPPICGYACRRG